MTDNSPYYYTKAEQREARTKKEVEGAVKRSHLEVSEEYADQLV